VTAERLETIEKNERRSVRPISLQFGEAYFVQ
jgi:hypothetical protein